MRFRVLLSVLAILGVTSILTLGAGPTISAEEHGDDAMTAAMEVVQSCADCHDVDTPGYTHNPHLVLNDDPELASRYGVTNSCEGCHGDLQAHIDSGGDVAMIQGFGPDVPAVLETETCLECHSDAHPRFFASSHAQAGLACTDCHSIHASDSAENLPMPLEGPLAAELADSVGAAEAVCSECHAGVFAEFEFNERHRLHEGVVGCTDCHNPHEPATRMNLGGFKQQQCVECHADKGGPFVFEHGSSLVEGCTACHSPHGSPNRHQLKFQNVAELCYSCHAAVPGFHTRFTAGTQCTSCHSAIHGSNFHEAFLK